MAGKQGHRGWGWVRPSGRRHPKRWHASYIGPDRVRHNAPSTFGRKADAAHWLASERRLIDLGAWTPPADRATAKGVTLALYGPQWIEQRTVRGQPLRPRTKGHYESLFNEHIKPTSIAKIPIAAITPQAVRSWYANTLVDRPTYRSHAYGLLHSMLATAVSDGHINTNPAQIRGAGSVTAKKQAVILDVGEVAALADAIDPRYKALVLISAWCGLRWGEVTELRRKDFDDEAAIITVGRAVVHKPECIIDTPKTHRVRTVVTPPHIRPVILAHLASATNVAPDALVFPAERSCHLNDKTFRRYFHAALKAIGRDGKTKPKPAIHDLRHFAGTQAARVGSLRETMERLGHTTVKASMTYQNAVSGRDIAVAEALSALATTSE
ncbi:tyrosine-type recombinase/integrase [Mycolicibacterium sp. XJ662]